MKLSSIIIIAMVAILLAALHFVPIAQADGYVATSPTEEKLCIGYTQAINKNYRLIANGYSQFKNAKDSYNNAINTGFCGYRPVSAKLYIL